MRSVETMRAGGETRHRTGHTSRTHRHRTLSCCCVEPLPRSV